MTDLIIDVLITHNVLYLQSLSTISEQQTMQDIQQTVYMCVGMGFKTDLKLV